VVIPHHARVTTDDLFGDLRLDELRQVVLHVIIETACGR
jgi:hypothetical protein